jgi:hypothetical protein
MRHTRPLIELINNRFETIVVNFLRRTVVSNIPHFLSERGSEFKKAKVVFYHTGMVWEMPT